MFKKTSAVASRRGRVLGIAIALSLVVTGMSIPAVSTPVSAATSKKGVLVVKLTSVPKGAKAKVVVTGPKKYKMVVTSKTTLRNLKPGTYKVTTRTFKVKKGSKKGTYYPSSKTIKVTVKKGKTSRTSVSFSRTTLAIAPIALSKGAKAKVTLKGPKGYKKTLTLTKATKIYNMKPGRYTLTVKNFTVKKTKGVLKAGKYYPVITAPIIEVKKGGTAKFRPDYTNIVALKTVVAGVPQVVSSAVPTAAGAVGSIILVGDYAVGDIVAGDVTPVTPDGVLVRLTGVFGPNPAGGTIFSTVNVPLAEAVPRGDLTITTTSAVGLTGANEDGHGARIANAATNPFTKNVACSATASMNVEAKVEGLITTTMDADWDVWHPSNSVVTLSAVASVSGSVGADVNGAAQCTLAKTDLLAHPVALPTVRFSVGPVPIVLKNSLQFTAQGDATTQATISTSANAAVTTSVTAKIDKDGLHTSFQEPTPAFTYEPPSATATGNAHFWLGARVNMDFYGVAGPYVSAAIGPSVDVDVNGSPWWKIAGNVKAGAGIRIDALGFTRSAEKDDIIAKSWTIADSGAPLVTGDTQNPTAPVGGPALRNLSSYTVGSDLDCKLNTQQDVEGEFYGDTACGTFAVVNGELYAPGYTPAGTLGTRSTWERLSQTSTGTGTVADPFVVTTVVGAGSTGIQLTQTDTWASSGTSISTKIRVTNYGGADNQVRVYRGIDCYLGDSDRGTGELRLSGQLVGCLRTIPTGELVTLRLQALTPGATVTEGFYADTWAQVAAKGDLNNGCRCSDDIDNSIAIAWNPVVPAQQSLVFKSELSLTRP
jgi:hypothetical protein